jgi:CspA family cold shock protein
VVREWHDDEGWGVLDSDVTPGGCWAHFSNLDMDGFRSAEPGQVVDFAYEAGWQDGFDFRASDVRLEGVPPATPRPPSPASGAYSSTLTVTFDDAPERNFTRRGDEPLPQDP